MNRIRRGLSLPIAGEPEKVIHDGPKIKTVALIGFDYHGMKPTMEVQLGDKVKLGQVLFRDKKTDGVLYTSPAAGTVSAINRGDKRVLKSVVIEIDSGEEKYEKFSSYSSQDLDGLSNEQARDNLVKSGLWTALKTRPYSKVPSPTSHANSIFVTAMDTNPLAADPDLIINQSSDDFINGLKVLSKLESGNVYVCKQAGSNVPDSASENVVNKEFSGIHPAGNAGTHIHFIDPVNTDKTVWSISYQDVIAIGQLFLSGTLPVQRIISLAGPQVEKPTLLRTRLGASLSELTQDKLKSGTNRIISGSVFGGRATSGTLSYLGRYHQQVSVLSEQETRPFLHYLRPGFDRFSALPIYISRLFRNKKFNFTTTTGGSERAMVPMGSYEKVMPLDILPTQLLRALIVGDTETAQKLGCLELDEDDLALCTYVCPGKYEYGPILRSNLKRIEKEG